MSGTIVVMTDRKTFLIYARNFIFGAEDSLVSTVGLLAGVVSAGVPLKQIIISGVILICVEAFSMSVGSFLSETATEESEKKHHSPIIAATIMFVSYFVSGLIPLTPYLLMSIEHAFWWSIIASLVALFALGAISGKILQINVRKNSFRMLIVGGLAIGFGVLVGTVLR